jgi:hypothetical protein
MPFASLCVSSQAGSDVIVMVAATLKKYDFGGGGASRNRELLRGVDARSPLGKFKLFWVQDGGPGALPVVGPGRSV